MGTTPATWKHVLEAKRDSLTADEALLVELLAQGLNHPQIAVKLGLKRSGVWHRVKKLRTRLNLTD